jgi:hypothetical protein
MKLATGPGDSITPRRLHAAVCLHCNPMASDDRLFMDCIVAAVNVWRVAASYKA